MTFSKKLLHIIFFFITLFWLGAYLFYQVFADSRFSRLNALPFHFPVLYDPVVSPDPEKIEVVCDSICYFLADGGKIRSRTDGDAAGGLTKLTLRFYDPYHGLIGYEDDQSNPNFFVIDTKGEFLQVVRLKLPYISFTFEAYYPGSQLIQFHASTGKTFLYSANKPELFRL